MVSFPLHLPVWSSIHVADAISKDGEEFDVFIGLNKKQVLEIRDLSLDKNDEELQNNTGDKEIFNDDSSYLNWYKTGRIPFCLVNKRTDIIAALMWIGPKPLGQKLIHLNIQQEKDNWYAVFCRSYPPFRNKGLMTNFIKFIIDTYKSCFPGIKFWVGMNYDNIPAKKIFTALEFKTDEKESKLEENWLVMTQA